jgi:hypothetical protein
MSYFNWKMSGFKEYQAFEIGEIAELAKECKVRVLVVFY